MYTRIVNRGTSRETGLYAFTWQDVTFYDFSMNIVRDSSLQIWRKLFDCMQARNLWRRKPLICFNNIEFEGGVRSDVSKMGYLSWIVGSTDEIAA